MEPINSWHYPVGKEKREIFAIVVMLIFLFCLIFIHLGMSWELNYAREIIDARDQELALCWKLNIRPNPKPNLKSLIETRIQALQPRLDSALRTQIADAILENSRKYKLSPSLVLHLICRETVPRFNPLSKSSKDALGLMQVRYKVHIKDIPELAKIKSNELYHIDNNINFGCQILRNYIDSENSLDKALKRYVGGEVKGYVMDIYRMMAEWEQGKYN